MADINTALPASKDAVDELIVVGQNTGPAWTAPRAPGKWPPSQIVEHVARAPDEGQARLEAAHRTFDEACRQLASRDGRIRTTTFGVVGVDDYVRFMEVHTHHHGKQMPLRQ